VKQSIRGYADGVIALAGGSPGGLAPSAHGTELAGVAADLSGVSGVIAGSDDLRRALSDPGVALDGRRGLFDQLFGSRVSAEAMAAIGFVLTVGRTPDTVADIEWLAARLDAAANDLEPVGDVVLGTKGAEERADGFATAILTSVDGQNALGELEDELFRFSRAVAGSAELAAALTSRDYPSSVRQSVIRDLLADKAGAATVHLATYAARIGRPRDFEVLLDHLVERVASEANRRVAEVRSAVDLDDAQQAKLADALGRSVGRRVEVRLTVDPSVVAGFVATIGDTVVDGSARHQLELLKEQLVMPDSFNITTGERQ
jgi:F-type H+-transporting ATPase subunit delta